MLIPLILKTNADNFVPLSRTPWGGQRIGTIKASVLDPSRLQANERIGESWEISTDPQFESFIKAPQMWSQKSLVTFLQQHAAEFLGNGIFNTFGSHCPLLLKWLHAQDVLSVQLHPANGNPRLNSQECGKPESWLVLDTEPGGHLYLGFQENLSKHEILTALLSDSPESCLHRIAPKVLDYIAVPPGCVHAVGPGVLVAEPQLVLPGKAGKTWRLSDWGRKYNSKGERDPGGQSRPLHIKEAVEYIDFSLPRGKKLEELLIQNMTQSNRFLGNTYNPFATQIYNQEGSFRHEALVAGQFSLLTVWGGKVTLMSKNEESFEVRGGESAMISARLSHLELTLQSTGNDRPAAAFFALKKED
jgi:mannose-6-phosphate isomerase